MSIIKTIQQRIKELDKRIDQLEKRKGGRPGGRLREMANWIEELFEDEDELPVHKIMTKASHKGYNQLMVNNARRQLLSDKIGVAHTKGLGWTWIKLNEGIE